MTPRHTYCGQPVTLDEWFAHTKNCPECIRLHAEDLAKLRLTAPWLVVRRDEMTDSERAATDRYVAAVNARCDDQA